MFSDLVLECLLDDSNTVYSATTCLQHLFAIESNDTTVEHDTLTDEVQILEDLSVCYYVKFLSISVYLSSTSFILLYTLDSQAASMYTDHKGNYLQKYYFC